MFKLLVPILGVMALSGCVASPSTNSEFSSKENLLIQTNNYSQLVNLYKEELRTKESKVLRIKLSEAYLKAGDAESALFYIAPITQSSEVLVPALMIQAHSQYELGELVRASETIKRLESAGKLTAEGENLAGVINAGQGEYKLAKHYFNLSREHLFDDIKVKNNLAVIDMVESDYKKAVQRLLPIYLNEQADDQIIANLTLAMAKLGNFEYVKSILGSSYSHEEAIERFAALRNAKVVEPTSQNLAIKSIKADVDENPTLL